MSSNTPRASARRRRNSRDDYFDHGSSAGFNYHPTINASSTSLLPAVEQVIKVIEAEKIAQQLVSDADILHFMSPPSAYDLLDPPIPLEHCSHLSLNLPLLSSPMISDYSMPRSTPKARRQMVGMGKKANYSDFDLSQLKLDEPAPEVVSELPNGHGVTIVGTRLPNGEVTTRIKYDRQLMLALSHSPFSLAQPENYPQIIRDMEEMIPVYPRRYIPREFMPEEAVSSTSSESKTS